MINDKSKFWKVKKVLITGHQGFLGSWLTRTLVDLRAEIIGIDIVKNSRNCLFPDLKTKIKSIKGDVSDLYLIKTVIKKYKPEIVFHLAAQAIVGKSLTDPIRTFRSNIQGTWNILEACRGKSFIEAVIIASSDKAYGAHKTLPYKENAALLGNHPYDVSKSCADLISAAYFHTYAVPVAITRCGNIYGPGDFNFSRIVPDAIRCAILDKTLLIRSDGKFTRDYVYVEDIVNGYILLAQKLQSLHLSGEAFNFSDDNPLTVKEIVKKIYDLVRKQPRFRILNKGKYEIKHQYLDSSKAKKIIKWRSKFTLEEGLRKTINWYRNHFKTKKV